MSKIVRMLSFILLSIFVLCNNSSADDPSDFRPDQSSIPTKPPEGAIVLLGEGKHQFVSMSGTAIDWQMKDDSLTVVRNGERVNHIVSQWHFHDADIHVEFVVDKKGQGNSGIYIHGNYEMQILDSFPQKELSEQDEGALYGFAKPLVNAARPAGQWQVYDIRYRAPRRNSEGKIVEPGTVTAWLNGKLVQDNTKFDEPRSVYHPFRYGTTPYLTVIAKQQKETQVGPLFLQDHDSPTQFRNVWIKPLDDKAFRYEPK